jgi:hypothetical protein
MEPKQNSLQPLSDTEKSALVSQIKVTSEGSVLSVSTIYQVTHTAVQFVLPQLAKLINDSRASNTFPFLFLIYFIT